VEENAKEVELYVYCGAVNVYFGHIGCREMRRCSEVHQVSMISRMHSQLAVHDMKAKQNGSLASCS
jgi:hypothetical protein